MKSSWLQTILDILYNILGGSKGDPSPIQNKNPTPVPQTPPTQNPTTPIPISDEVPYLPESKALLGLHNSERVQAGVPTLKYSSKLEAAAKYHAEDMARTSNFSHTGSGNTTPDKRVADTGLKTSFVAENIAMGYTSVVDVHEGWMNSPGHKANILSPQATHVGFYNVNSPKRYWVAVFCAINQSTQSLDTTVITSYSGPLEKI
jgi:uncharacterized protein YkwD